MAGPVESRISSSNALSSAPGTAPIHLVAWSPRTTNECCLQAKAAIVISSGFAIVGVMGHRPFRPSVASDLGGVFFFEVSGQFVSCTPWLGCWEGFCLGRVG